MSEFHAKVYRLMNQNPGMSYGEACRLCGRAGGRKKKPKSQKARPKSWGQTDDRKRREYIKKMEERGLW